MAPANSGASYRFDPDLAPCASMFTPLDPDDHAGSRAAMAEMAQSLPS